MGQTESAGRRLRNAVAAEIPLQVVGTINAYAARLAECAGFRALYLSGAGVAVASLGIPDLAITTPDDVLTDVRRITEISDLPILVDADTGWGGAFNIARTVKSLIRFGAGGLHIEDQVATKRCGHRPNKVIVSCTEMVDRIKAAVDAKTDSEFVIMARTDALAVEGVNSVIDRLSACVEAGADMVFPEAVTDLAIYRSVAAATRVPVLANITEFGVSPLFTVRELKEADVSLVLYPLSAFRAMSAAAVKVYRALRADGTQKSVLDLMQTRADLYQVIGYDAYEQKLDRLYAAQNDGQREE